MSRCGYSEDSDDQWAMIRWRGAVNSAINGKRGQAFLKEMLAAMDAMPVKELIADDLVAVAPAGNVHVCAIGSVMVARGIDASNIDPEDPERIAKTMGISSALVQEIEYINDEPSWRERTTPEKRFEMVREWIVRHIKEDPAS